MLYKSWSAAQTVSHTGMHWANLKQTCNINEHDISQSADEVFTEHHMYIEDKSDA